MKLGLFAYLFRDRSFEEMLDLVQAAGLDAVEISTGGYLTPPHCRAEELLEDEGKLRSWRGAIERRGLFISALSCHGNPLHPDRAIAQRHHESFLTTIKLAQRLEVPCVTLFSGCPGDGEDARHPNWITCAWPREFQELLTWQWATKVIPYWREQAPFARDHGINLAFEMHPGFVVYNPATLLRLRAACGENVGANLDPSHLFWQGMDPLEVIRALGREDAIFHVHAKDTAIDPHLRAVNGVLETAPNRQVEGRSWLFRTVGYGHDELFWRSFTSMLRRVGYDYVLSIEHEDPLLSADEGFSRAVSILRSVMPGPIST